MIVFIVYFNEDCICRLQLLFFQNFKCILQIDNIIMQYQIKFIDVFDVKVEMFLSD